MAIWSWMYSLMDPVPAFLIAIILVGLLVARLGLHPFLGLLTSALVYGLLTGMGPEVIGHVTTGLARFFSALAIIIFSGSVIAEYLRRSRSVDRIVADLLGLVGQKRGLMASGLSGYLVSLPVMCCITSYLILEPVAKEMGRRTDRSKARFQYMVAAASVISYNLIYPSPVMVALTGALDVRPVDTLKLAIPLSLLLLVAAHFYLSRLPLIEAGIAPGPPANLPSRLRAWLPLVLPMALILAGLVTEAARFVGNPNVALLLGALVSVVLARKKEIVKAATRRAGVIIFDLCGAGAFGYVIAQSDLGAALQGSLGGWVPLFAIPFILAALVQLAQGSRLVTVVIAAEVMRGYPLDGLTLILLISAGAFTFSYLSDPYFWLIKDTTGSSLREVVFGYTAPLTLCGLIVLAAAALRWFFLVVHEV